MKCKCGNDPDMDVYCKIYSPEDLDIEPEYEDFDTSLCYKCYFKLKYPNNWRKKYIEFKEEKQS